MKINAVTLMTFSALVAVAGLLFTGFTLPKSTEMIKATTGGEMTFTIRTVSAGGNYAPKHVLAIWVEQGGDFIKTRKAMANQRKQYLYTWKNASNYNVVDAITGSTLTSHQTHTVSWDCTDLDGNILPDGEYDVYTEFTDKHAQGPLYLISFTKGPDVVSLSPTDETYFKDIELEFVPYIAEFSANVTDLCQWNVVTFTDESVNASSWEWDFGTGADPPTASTQGPHTVVYNEPGLVSVSLNINGSVTETKTGYITVNAAPTAEFSYSSNGLTVEFTNLSGNATSYVWDFGDGNTSIENNPTHTYATAGTFEVTLDASYMDCSDSETHTVIVPLVGLNATGSTGEIKVFPNPSSGFFIVDPGTHLHIKKIGIFAADGTFVPMDSYRISSDLTPQVDASELDAGVYFLQIDTGEAIIIRKIVIRP
jgi:PKD repeat protein